MYNRCNKPVEKLAGKHTYWMFFMHVQVNQQVNEMWSRF